MGILFPGTPEPDFRPADAGYRPRCTNTIDCLIELLQTNKGRVAAITGAGISAHALPTFRSRDHTALWDVLKAPIVAKATFYDNPRPAWNLAANVRSLQLRGALQPSLSHKVLHELLQSGYLSKIITQNVDSLHSFPGDENLVIELHGCITDFGQCETCKVDRPVDLMKILEDGNVPHCPACDAVLKVPVAFFGDEIPKEVRELTRDTVDQSDVLILVGTHCAVDPVLSIVQEAKRKGIILVEINTDTTNATQVMDVTLSGPCDGILDQLAASLFPDRSFGE